MRDALGAAEAREANPNPISNVLPKPNPNPTFLAPYPKPNP